MPFTGLLHRHWTLRRLMPFRGCDSYGPAAKARVWILWYSLHHRIRAAIVQAEDSPVPYQRNYCYIVSLVTYHRINPYVDSLIWSYPQAGNKYATFCLLFALYYHLKLKNMTYTTWCMKIMKQHFCFSYFLNSNLGKLCILELNNSTASVTWQPNLTSLNWHRAIFNKSSLISCW